MDEMDRWTVLLCLVALLAFGLVESVQAVEAVARVVDFTGKLATVAGW